MATVVITFFLFAQFNVYKMDAELIENHRDSFHSRREKRWSMNSQRLEEIVAELMKPISNDNRRSFDTDLCALLEEYLTEAGLHALEEEEGGSPCSDIVLPNFAEIALLLQQSAAIYGRKVDCLYQHVLQVSESVHNCTSESQREGADAPTSAPTSRRKRKASADGTGEFVEIVLEACPTATREREAPRPPPTLSRTYVELEPRIAGAADLPLYDYSDEHIGMLTDFHVAWRLHDGMLVDELQGGAHAGASALRALSLVELQAEMAARAPSSPPASHRLSPLSPGHHSTPLPSPRAEEDTELDVDLTRPHVIKRERKRRSAVHIDHLFDENIKIVISKDLLRKLRKVQDFCIDQCWIEEVIKRRKSNILNARKQLLQEKPPEKGFRGWSRKEVSLATDAVLALRSAYGDLESDDDGFFEQSGEEDNALVKARTATAGPADNTTETNVAADNEDERDADTELPPDVGAEAPAQGEEAAEGEALAAATAPEQQAAVLPPPPPLLPLVPLVPPLVPSSSAVAPVEMLADVTPLDPEAAARAAALAAWRAEVLRRAAESEARGAPDVRALGDQLVHALDGAEDEPRDFTSVLRDEAKHESDVSRLMLTTLFLANSGNVEIVCGAPLSLNSFSVRLKSRDTSRYAQAAAAARELYS